MASPSKVRSCLCSLFSSSPIDTSYDLLLQHFLFQQHRTLFTMEAVGIVASVVTIIHVIDNITDIISDIRNAPRDYTQFAAELGPLYGLLVAFSGHYDFSDPFEPWHDAARSIGYSGGCLDEFRQTIVSLQAKISITDPMGKACRVLTWKLDKKEIDPYSNESNA